MYLQHYEFMGNMFLRLRLLFSDFRTNYTDYLSYPISRVLPKNGENICFSLNELKLKELKFVRILDVIIWIKSYTLLLHSPMDRANLCYRRPNLSETNLVIYVHVVFCIYLNLITFKTCIAYLEKHMHVSFIFLHTILGLFFSCA